MGGCCPWCLPDSDSMLGTVGGLADRPSTCGLRARPKKQGCARCPQGVCLSLEAGGWTSQGSSGGKAGLAVGDVRGVT